MMASSTVRIRPAGEGDREFVLALVPELLAFGPPPWRERKGMIATDAQVMDDALAGRMEDSTVLIAEDEQGARLGFIHLCGERDYYLQETCGHVADIVVRSEARGKGVGRALMAAGERWARERRYPLLSLNVFTENRGPRAFYEDLGFRAETVRYVKPIE
jgi:GNAT superfamily N-acetyltransferase